MADTELRDGWTWPVGDQGCWDWVNREADLPQSILRHCSSFETCIHAGANAGFYVRQYAARFRRVYAVEPEPTNFHCLVQNCPEPNVIKIQAALGHERGLVRLDNEFDKLNCGGFRVEPGDTTLVLKMDDLFGWIDLIHLDVEGHESFVLRGGEQILRNYQPVVCLETIRPERDLYAAEFLSDLGYVVAEKLQHDTIFKHKG